jgi:hypothetical protein
LSTSGFAWSVHDVMAEVKNFITVARKRLEDLVKAKLSLERIARERGISTDSVRQKMRRLELEVVVGDNCVRLLLPMIFQKTRSHLSKSSYLYRVLLLAVEQLHLVDPHRA